MARWLALLSALLGAAACTSPAQVEHCADPPVVPVELASPPTWHQDVRPIMAARCMRCHYPEGIGRYLLTSYEEVYALRGAVQAAVTEKRMPPWFAAHCCGPLADDISLDDRQIGIIDAWVDAGAPEGDPSQPGDPIPVAGGLSRVDLELKMPEPYTPQPMPGRLDDFRCFVLDWPVDHPVMVTGLNPLPGARQVVHHLIVGVLSPEQGADAQAASGQDGRPGLPCEGGFGDIPVDAILGGSLVGSDFPSGIGKRVEPGSKIMFNIHYSSADAASAVDRSAIQLKIDEPSDAFVELGGIVVSNPAWLVADAFRIRAGESAKRYTAQLDPRIFTGGKGVALRSVTPHMHYLGSQILVSIIRNNGDHDCLLDIPNWIFGWEQPYWLAAPVKIELGDELSVSCTFDNTEARQPLVNGQRLAPRDVAWGTDNQDMCAAFLSFTQVDD